MSWDPSYPVNILVAYPYFSAKMRQELDALRQVVPVRLLIDSGAFTAYNSGKPVSLDKYCDFLRTLPTDTVYAQLDVIGDEQASFDNLQLMNQQGLNPLPVFTRGSAPETLEALRESNQYVMLGGVAQGTGRHQYVNWFSGINAGRPVHWLGFVDPEFIAHYRPTSVDSSSWAGAARFGGLPLYVGGGKFKLITRPECREFGIRRMFATHRLLEEETTVLLSSRTAWRNTPQAEGRLAFRVSAAAHLLRARDIEERFGTLCYLAVTGADQVGTIQKAVEGLLRRS